MTPDGRYIVVRGRLWRATNPGLTPEARLRLVRDLMAARRDVGAARRQGNRAALADAGFRVDAAKVDLGERGTVWWLDGEPDLNRRMARTTAYADWYRSLDPEAAGL
jgi:hypothetical protein